MPFVKLTTVQKLTCEQKTALSKSFSEVMKHVPGKEDTGAILYFEDGETFMIDGCEMEDFVFVETDICGKFPYQVKYDFTVASFNAIKKVLGTDDANMSMKIQEHLGWGGFGDYIETDEAGKPLAKR